MQQRALETRKKILDAALAVFSAKGFAGATVDDIAASAGVNKQRLYAYFGSKQGLFEALLRQIFQRVELFSQAMIRDASAHPERLTEILLKGFLGVHATHPYFWRLLSWANLEAASVAAALDQARQAENEALRAVFERAVAAGLLKKIHFETYLFTLLAVSYFYFSNHQTLSHTLDVQLASGAWSRRLCDDLAAVFRA